MDYKPALDTRQSFKRTLERTRSPLSMLKNGDSAQDHAVILNIIPAWAEIVNFPEFHLAASGSVLK